MYGCVRCGRGPLRRILHHLPDTEGVSTVTALFCRRGIQLKQLLMKQVTPTSNSAMQ